MEGFSPLDTTGRFHLLQDTDGDGLEDEVQTFWSESGPNSFMPVGIDKMLAPEELRDLITYLLTENRTLRKRSGNRNSQSNLHEGLPLRLFR